MGRDKDASGFLARRKCVFMNVFVDRTADSVQTIVAVREDAGHRKFLEPAGNGRLQDANIGVVIDPHGIKLDAEVFPIVRLTVGLQDLVGHGSFRAVSGVVPTFSFPLRITLFLMT